MKLYHRENYLKNIRGFYHETDLIKVITGIRRCGKSCLMQSIAEELIASGVKEENTTPSGPPLRISWKFGRSVPARTSSASMRARILLLLCITVSRPPGPGMWM